MSTKHRKMALKLKDQAFIQRFTTLLLTGGKLKVTGIGVFEIKRIAAREGYNVGTGGRCQIKEHNKLSFRPAKPLKVSIQSHGK